MKRLFQVKNREGSAVRQEDGTPAYFADKASAKLVRDHYNRQDSQHNRYPVSPGPDHKGLLPKKSRGHIRRNRKES